MISYGKKSSLATVVFDEGLGFKQVLNDKLGNIKKLFEFTTGDANYKYIQGMAVTDKYIVVGVINNTDTDNTWVYVFDKNTYALASLPSNPIIDRSFGHCNDMTYNPRTNRIIIVNGNNLHILNADTFATIETKNMPFYCVGIGYDYDTDQYVIDDGGNRTYHILNNSFVEKSSFAVNDYGLTIQGLEVNKGLIYASFYDAGQITPYQTSNNPAMMYSGVVLVYTLAGQLVKSFLLPSTAKGEIESISFYNNGKFLLNYNFWNGTCKLYTVDLLSQTTFNENDLDEINYNENSVYKVNNGDDLNNYTTAGIYRINGAGIAATLLNCPTSVNAKLIVECLQVSDCVMQTIKTRNNLVFHRTLFEGAWSSWKLKGNICGSVLANITAANTPTTVHIDLTSYGLTTYPIVTVTPYTSAPQNCRVGANNVTATGFDIIAVRTDAATSYTCAWIAVI